MSWVQSKASLRFIVTALLVTGATAAAANVLVVRSSGPSAKSYPPGRSLPDNARITLQANDSVVILANGATRTFRGPGNFSPTGAVQAGTRTVATADGRRARIGAVRNAGLVPRSPTIWHVDATQSGTFCLATTSEVNLWRPDATQAASLTITGPGGESQTIDWPAGQAVISWPASVGIADGGEYRLRQAGVAVPTRITFQTLTTQPTDLQAVAQALIANDCAEQLNVLVETTEDGAPQG